MPWSVKGIDDDTRDEARRAAQAAGLTVGAWIERAIRRTVGQIPMTDDRTRPPNAGPPNAGPPNAGPPKVDSPGQGYPGRRVPARLDPELLGALEQLADKIKTMETDVSGRLTPLAQAIAALERRLQADEAERQAAAAAGQFHDPSARHSGGDHHAGQPGERPDYRPDYRPDHRPDHRHDRAAPGAVPGAGQGGLSSGGHPGPRYAQGTPPRRPAPPRQDGGFVGGRRRSRWPLAAVILLLAVILGGGAYALYEGSGRDLDRMVADLQRSLGMGAPQEGPTPGTPPETPAGGPVVADAPRAPAGPSADAPTAQDAASAPPGVALPAPDSGATDLPAAPLPAESPPAGDPAAADPAGVEMADATASDADPADADPAGAPVQDETQEPVNEDSPLEVVQAAAEAGNADAQVELGLRHAMGEGDGEQSYAEAVRWFREAAERNRVVAQYNLGVLYERGLGVEANPPEAVRWYRLAAAQGHPGAQYNLGVAFAEGRGVEQDYAAAAVLFRDAADAGLPRAMFNLGLTYEYGLGVQASENEAASWYQQAAAAGDTSAAERMAQITARREAAAAPDQTLSQSEIGGVVEQIARCWNVPSGARGASDLKIEIAVEINADGTVRDARIVDTARYGSDDVFRAVAESARRAVLNPQCSPLRLPPGKYEAWQRTTFVFDPSRML